jgi:N-acetylgalactosamine-N,N'-diacetylbacillosaminyl-diphospho-undecaprenol 4-alpha-N-acetylgalactosaminyltransferase
MSKLFGIKAKVLISERCYTPFTYNKDSFAGRIKMWMLKKFYPKADAILPNSKGTIEALQSFYQIKSDYYVVKNPTDIARIKALAEISPIQHIDFNRFTFINVAAFREEKNQDLLIDAMAEIREMDFQLVLVGKGENQERIKQKVSSLGLNDKVIFTGFTDNPYQYMARSACFLLSSFSEGFPNVLIESMVCGLPILSVDCKTGPRELLAPSTDLNTVIPKDGFEIAAYGILCAHNCKTSLAAAMKWVLNNKKSIEPYREKGKQKANDFEIKNVCDEFSVIFDRYLEK